MRANYSTSGGGGSPWAIFAAVLVGCWAVAATVLLQGGGWAVDQVLLLGGLDRLVPLWPGLGLLTVLLIGTVALPLALVPRSPMIRAAGRAWLAGALALGALEVLRAFPPVHHEVYLAALAATAALLALIATPAHPRGPLVPAARATRRRTPRRGRRGGTSCRGW